MNRSKYIRYILPLVALLALLPACKEKVEVPQPTSFNLKVDESVVITLPSSSSYTVIVDMPLVDYKLVGENLTVTALKEGTTSVKVILDSGKEHKYTFTISQNTSQIGFKVSTKPRIEAWHKGEVIYTEQTAGLQVTCEPGTGITGEATDASTRSYGFIYPESGKLLRFTAQGNFAQTGELSNGIAAMRESETSPLQYEECEISIEKVNSEGKIWFILKFKNRSDIRIVTEGF